MRPGMHSLSTAHLLGIEESPARGKRNRRDR